MFREYEDVIEPYWVALPLVLRNAVSQYQPRWTCWDPEARKDWIREPPEIAITDESFFPFFRRGMEFEEFVPEFGHWYGGGKLTACFVGIRTGESLNRWRTIASSTKQRMDGKGYTTWVGEALYNVYPIYDWRTEDIWRYHGKYPDRQYNKLYDRMHQAGLTVHQMRICQPYGDDQRKGLWLFHIIEPDTWSRVVARVNGANQGALYAQESGNILGINKVTLPPGHTWQSFDAAAAVDAGADGGPLQGQDRGVPALVGPERLPERHTGRRTYQRQESAELEAHMQGPAPQRLLVQRAVVHADQLGGV